MTSLREQIAGKQRRRVVVPVQLSDPASDQHQGMAARVALVQAMGRDPRDAGEIADLQRQVDDADTLVQAHYADVELQALPAGEWEAAQQQWLAESGDTLNWREALPHLLAVSCVDEELRDVAWWTSTLASDAWSEGDIEALRFALLHLNVTAQDPRLPKG